MVLEFEDLNAATEHYAKKLLESSPVISTNDRNSDRYKNKLGGEVLQEFFKIKNPTRVIGTYQHHKAFKWWTYGEILSEMLNLDPPLMYKYKPELFSQHYDLLEDGRMQYTYSNRFVEFNQFVNLFKRLQENPNSKRGVVQIFTPYDTSPERQDAPCTLGESFIQRDGKLHMTFMMRSWDFFGGFKTYDFALQSFIQQSVASWLGFEPGDLGVYVTSLHYYNRDRSQLEDLVSEINSSKKPSDSLILDSNLNIQEFYKQLRLVKLAEELAFSGNIERAEQVKGELTCELFADMANTYIKKNIVTKK